MSSWHSYPSIYNLGHRAVKDLLNFPHVVEEKVDGSQISFGLINESAGAIGGQGLEYCDEYKLRVRSKGAEMNPDAPEKMFAKGVAHIKSIQHLLQPGWTYRGEYLAKPQHNTLVYDRIPAGHIILFDVSTGDNEWLDPEAKWLEAQRIGLECVPLLNAHVSTDRLNGAQIVYKTVTLEYMRELLDTRTSILGGQLIEGVVIKPLVELYGIDKKTLMGKFVSERFREAHKQAWKVTSPNSGDILDQLAKTYKVEGRWLKSIQHLRDAGQLQDAPQDIPALIREIQADLGKEEKENIQRLLWKWAWPHLQRAVTKGFPEFYKDQLLRKQFIDEPVDGIEVAQ